ncbi:MAG: DUF481 domain-containing protein [Bryobacteraceae bacterium]|nr:DUF481 domain-containing protein [Bryobacteraceae bacterium]
MKNCFFRGVLSLMVLLAGTLRADQVTLKNGDRITGAIVKKDGKELTIKSDLFGVVTVPWEQVESVKSETPLNVVLSSGQTVQTPIATSAGKVELTATDKTVEPADVLAIRDAAEQAAYDRLQNPGWVDLWAGPATLGFAGTQGNARTRTLTTALNASRQTQNDKTTIYFSAIKASALVEGVSAGTAQAVRGGLGYDHDLSPKLFFNVFNDYEYDRFQDLDLRFVLGGGLGYHVWKAERGSLDLSAGAAYNHSRFGPAAPAVAFTRNAAEAYWGNDFNYSLTGATSLVQSYRMFNNLSDTGEYRINFDLGAVTKITTWLTWNIGLSDRFLSNPVAGRQRNDFLYTTGLGVTFAR